MPEGVSLQSLLSINEPYLVQNSQLSLLDTEIPTPFDQTVQLPRARPMTWSARGPPGVDKKKYCALDHSDLSDHSPACSGKASDNPDL